MTVESIKFGDIDKSEFKTRTKQMFFTVAANSIKPSAGTGNNNPPAIVFLGSPSWQLSRKAQQNFLFSLSAVAFGRNMDNIATSSLFSRALRILSCPTVFVFKCNLDFKSSLKTSADIFIKKKNYKIKSAVKG